MSDWLEEIKRKLPDGHLVPITRDEVRRLIHRIEAAEAVVTKASALWAVMNPWRVPGYVADVNEELRLSLVAWETSKE